MLEHFDQFSNPPYPSHRSFNATNHYQHIAEGPIPENTIATLAASDGAVLEERGAGIFYMPHGLTIDHNGNMWLTDVALHQGFKFMPGRDYSHFLSALKTQTNQFLLLTPANRYKPTQQVIEP